MTYDPRFAGSNPPCTSSLVDKGLFVMILPQMDQAPLYNAINQSLTILGRENRTIQDVTLGSYACPSDPGSGYAHEGDTQQMIGYGLASPGESLLMSFTSYSGCYGSFNVDAIPRPANGCTVAPQLMAQSDGTFGDASPIRMSSIQDGLSNTIAASEKATERFRQLDDDLTIYHRYGWYFTGNFGDTLFTTFYPPNMINRVAAAAGATQTYAASSFHPGGLNVLMGDASVRFIKETVQTWPYDPVTGAPVGAVQTNGGWWVDVPPRGVWQALGSRAGGELISDAAY